MRWTLTRSVLTAAAAAALVVASNAGAQAVKGPETIPLPNGFAPEGIASGTGSTVYAGSLASGDVVQADLRTGEVSIAVDAPDGRIAVGLKHSQRTQQIFVAGGPSGEAYVYDAHTGMEAAALALIPIGAGFINDVVVTREGAWFTESFQTPQLYFVSVSPDGSIGAVDALPLTGPVVDDYQPGGFNLNGIAATPNGSELIVVNSTVGALYTVDPETGESARIDLGGETLTNGDGILLDGTRLWVVRNQVNIVAEVRLAPDLSKGTVVSERTSDDFDVPTTIARQGNTLALVNARFGTTPTPDTQYDIVVIGR